MPMRTCFMIRAAYVMPGMLKSLPSRTTSLPNRSVSGARLLLLPLPLLCRLLTGSEAPFCLLATLLGSPFSSPSARDMLSAGSARATKCASAVFR